MIETQERNSLSVQLAEREEAGTRLQLFRREVLDRTSSYHSANIVLAHSRRNWLVFSFVTIITAALLGLIIFGDISRKVRVTGIVVAGTGSASVSSPISGAITQIRVQEGTMVKPGDLLFEVSTDHNSSQGSVTAAVKQRILAKQRAAVDEKTSLQAEGEQRANEILLKIAGARREVLALNEQLAHTNARLAIAQKKAERAALLTEKGFYSAAQRDEEDEKILDLKSALNALTRSREELLTRIDSLELEAKITRSNVRSSLAQLDRTEAALDQESVELDSRAVIGVVAATSGRVTNIAYGVGQHVAAGQNLLVIMPDANNLEVNLFVPNRAIGHLQERQEVSMRYHAFPFQYYGRHLGAITELGRAPFAPTELPSSLASTVLSNAQSTRQNNSAVPEGLYRIRVAINRPAAGESPLPLKPGMTLDADIIVGKVKIWQWMFEPFRLTN